jgi:phage terminase small subunit
MAGKPGRSGGARPGAGRKPATLASVVGSSHAASAEGSPAAAAPAVADTPLEFLVAVMQDPKAPLAARLKAAQAAAPFMHAKAAGAGGKKDSQRQAADRVSQGDLFAPAAPPRLVVSNG